ncbi:hypothetical protein AAHC03_01799 [Spirometra sp. Aus1]|nr:unnamed protein product [Spirometra erinaceieuropaei]
MSEQGQHVEEWIRRNPHGLQPLSTFPEDYPPMGRLNYNVPPIKLTLEDSPTALIPEPFWHGYTGARTHFVQQPMPSNAQFLLTGGYAPRRGGVSAVVTESPKPVHDLPPSVPCSTVTVAAMAGKDSMTTVIRPQIHPIQVDVSDSRLWRFDGRDHTFKTV